MPERTKAAVGGCKRFECRVVGFPRPTIQWFKDGKDITNNDRFEFDYSVDGVITMVIYNVTFTDQGVYNCRAENSEGWAATAAILHVRAVDSHAEESSVHEMKFEIGGPKTKEEDIIDGMSAVEIKSRYDNFISKIGGKSAVHNEVRTDANEDTLNYDFNIDNKENQHDKKILADIDIASKGKHSDDFHPVIETVTGGIKNPIESTVETVDMEAVDEGLYPKKRRLSDLDVHLRMMNKASPFDLMIDESEQETEGKFKDTSPVDTEKPNSNDTTRIDTSIEKNFEKSNTELFMLKREIKGDFGPTYIDGLDKEESKDTNAIAAKKQNQLDRIAPKQNTEFTDTCMTNVPSVITNDTKDDKDYDEEMEKEEEETIDDMMEFLSIDRKRSRRSTTTDSGLGDDDYRDSSPESDGLEDDKPGEKRRRSHGEHHKKKGYRPSSRQVSREEDVPSKQRKENIDDTKYTDGPTNKGEIESGSGSNTAGDSNTADDTVLMANVLSQDQKDMVDDSNAEPKESSPNRKQEVHNDAPVNLVCDNEEENIKTITFEGKQSSNQESDETPKRFGVPRIQIEEIEDSEVDESMDGTNAGQEESDGRRFIHHEIKVQHSETDGEICQDESSISEHIAAISDVVTEPWVDSNISEQLGLKTNVEIDEYPVSDANKITPTVDVFMDGSLSQTMPEQLEIEVEEIPQSDEVSQEQSKEEESENNNDLSLASAHSLSRNQNVKDFPSNFNSNKFSSEPIVKTKTCTGNDMDNKEEAPYNKIIKDDDANEQNDGNQISIDSGIDNESLISEQYSIMSESDVSHAKSRSEKDDDENEVPKSKQHSKGEESDEENIQNLQNEEKLQHLMGQESNSSTTDVNERMENEKNERRANLRKQHMVLESDEEDDGTRSRSMSIHDDDYFASTESLGMGLSRESLAFSQFDLSKVDPIPERDEPLSRSSSKDDQSHHDEEHLCVEQERFDACKFSEYSEEIDSSELLSSDPEDYGFRVAQKAKEISEELSSLNLAWSETTSYTDYTESSFYTTDADGISLDGIPEMVPAAAKHTNGQDSVRNVQVVPQKENRTIEIKASLGNECQSVPHTKPASEMHSVETEESGEHLTKAAIQERDVIDRNDIEHVESAPGVISEANPPIKTDIGAFEHDSKGDKKKNSEDKDIERLENKNEKESLDGNTQSIVDNDINNQTKTKGAKNALQKFELEDTNLNFRKDVPETDADKNNFELHEVETTMMHGDDNAMIMKIESDIGSTSYPMKDNHVVDVTTDLTSMEFPNDHTLTVKTDVTSKEPSQIPPRVLRATSDITIDSGESIVLEWEITGNPVPNITMYKDGKPLDLYDGEKIFKEDDYVSMEILDATSEDSGCYEIHLQNVLGYDISMINVRVEEVSKYIPDKRAPEGIYELFAYPPEFIVIPSDSVVQNGRTTVIKASVKGNPRPDITWYQDGRRISGDGEIDIIEEDDYSCLVIPNPGSTHAGQYICRATNELGMVEANFTLTHVGEAEPVKKKASTSVKSPSIPKEDVSNKSLLPKLQMEISESQEIFTRRFSVLSDYADDLNDVTVHKGEIVEVLDKSMATHWLVRKNDKKDQVFYIPSTVLNEKLIPDNNRKQNKLNTIDENLREKLRDRKVCDPQPPRPSVSIMTCLSMAFKALNHGLADWILVGFAPSHDNTTSLIQELVDCETDYVCDLKDLIDNYMQPLRTENVCTPVQKREKDVFSNIKELYDFHHEVLLPEMTKCYEKPENIAKMFLNKRESFTEYLPYLASRQRASQTLKDTEVQDFLQTYTKKIGDQSHALEDLLNRPVERIQDYIGLLKNLMKYTTAAGGDCTELMKAVQMLTDICQEVENIMLLSNVEGYHDNTEDLGPILGHEPVLVYNPTDSEQDLEEGVFQHHMFVFGDKLMLAQETGESTDDGRPRMKFDQILELRDVDISGICEEDSSFELWDASRHVAKSTESDNSSVLTLRTPNPRAKQALVRAIQEAQNALGVVRDENRKMPEHRKISTKTPKVKTSTPKKKVASATKEPTDIESDRSSDDFNLINVDNYLTPEFDDGTTRPIFKKKLQKTIVSENATAKLQCTVVGIPHPKVLWLKNNRPLKSSDRCKVKSDGDLHTLEFPEAKVDDTGLYTARAMNVNGSIISTAELLVGNAQPSSLKKYHEGLDDAEYQTPAYFFQMNNCQVEEGRLARFDCRVVAYPKPDIVWMKDGKVVEPDKRFKLLNFNDEIYSLLIQDVEVLDTGRYTCWAHNKYGEAMTEAYLNVIALEEQLDDTDIAPKFLTKFYDQTVNENVPTEFQCMIAGKPKPAVRWLLDDIEIKPTENIKISCEQNLCSLLIKDAKLQDSGNYSCHIKNSLGEATCTAGLTVLDDKVKGVPMLPKFIKRVGDVTAHAGDEIIYEVVVVGEPKPKVSWLYNHKRISETHRRFKMSHDGDIYRLHMCELCTTDEGKVTCKAVNTEGEVYCSSNLAVKRPPQELEDKPAFKQKDFDAKYGCPPTFMKRLEDMYSEEGKSAKLECKVMGIPEPTVTWVKDGKALTPGHKYWINRDGGHCSLTVRDMSPSDVGIYSCTVANAAGEVSCLANLKLESVKHKEISLDKDQFGRRLSRDSIKSEGSHAVPSLPYDKPSLSDIREESVRLSWLPAYTSNLPQDARNVKYIIEARELPGFEWNKVASGIHGNTHLLKGLKPKSEYAFRVRAENQYGSSDTTQPCMMSREKPEEDEIMQKINVKSPDFKRPPKLPTSKPIVTDLGEETVRLAWKPAVAPATTKKAVPISYRLEAQELPSTDWMPLASRLRDTNFYLPELQKDRDYNVRVRAENKYGLSEPTEPLWLPRASTFPGVPIRRPEISDIEPTMARVSWARVEVPTYSADDEPLLYMLEMQVPPAREWQEVARDLAASSHVVSNLKPGQDYRFRVKARTPLGAYSEPSPITSMYRTLATTRAPIDRFELEETEPDFEGIRLAWNRVDIPPFDSSDEPLMYMIEINEPPIDEWRPLVSGLPTTRYRVTDLTPDRDYKFRVRALTPYGPSPPSYTLPVSYRRPSSVPRRMVSEEPQLLYDDTDALKLSWKPPTIDAKRPIKYQVQMQTPQSMTWKPLASGIPDTSYRIRGLGPSRDYTFRVVPETTMGPLQPLPPVSLTSLPAPRTMLQSRPEILDLEPEALTLSWQRPLIDPGLPVHYRIDLQEPPNLGWRPIASAVPDTRYRVTGLHPNRDYQFRVTPVTNIGDLDPLPYASITSMPVRPRLYPSEPKATEVGKDSIRLTWQPAEIPLFARQKLPVRYSVDMRTLPHSEWIPVVRSVNDTSYVVKGLRPDNDYQFRVKAHTDLGSSDFSLPVTVYRRPVPLFPRREPVITSLGPESIVLTWQPADLRSNMSHLPNVTYRIEVQDPPEIGQWRSLISNLSRTSYHVTGLRPDRDYLFRVRSQTDGITTEPTLPVYLSRRSGPPRMPREEPYIFEVHPESVKLQWRSVELPQRITDYSPVTYRLEMQESPRPEWTTLARGIPHTDFHVTNLHPDKEYSFRIRAENDMGIGEPTPPITLRKRSAPPTMPQDEPLIYDVSPNGSFRLSWRPADISTSFSDGSPVTYTIYVQEPPSSSWRPLVRRIPHTSYHVTSLRPDADYSFRIQAENEFGVSRPTLPIRLIRRTDWKTPVDLPEISDIDEESRSLRLQWRPRQMSPFDKTSMKYHVESWEPRARRWHPIASGIPDTNYRVTGIPLDQDYLFRVRAEAASALSEPTYPISLSRFRLSSRLPVYRPQLYDVEPESVRLSWHPHHTPGQDLVRLPRRYHLELRELPSQSWKPVAHDIPDTNYRVTGLRPHQDYEFRVRGLTDDGPTDFTSPVSLYRRPVISRFPLEGPSISAVEDDYVILKWRVVDVPSTSIDEQPLAFMIEAQRPPQYDWTPVARNIRGDNYRVTGLQRHQDYIFRIRAEYPSGLSEPSPIIPVYRRPIRPGVPISRPEIWEEEPYKARLRWRRVFIPPYHSLDTPIKYQIEVQEPPLRDWRPLTRGITMTEHDINDLTPRKDYLFRIRAELPNGDLSDPTPPIAYYRSRLPMTREPSKAYEYKVIEEDFSVPSRTYIDHLTTYIPPRLPIDKPDLFVSNLENATLSWKPARVPDRIRNTCNLTYTIEVRNPPGLDWRELVSGLTSTSYDLKNLHPRLDYLFRIRAHNEYGCSEPCLPVSLHRPIELSDDDLDYDDWDDPYKVTLGQLDAPIEEAPPKIPMEAPRITDNGVTARLTWLPARIPAYAKKTPITYIVEIKEPNIPGWSRLASGINDTNYFVEDLLPNKDYQFRIKAETQFGVSDPTLSVGLERTKMEYESPLLDLDFYEIFRKDWMWSDQKRPSVELRREESDTEVTPKSLVPGAPPRMPSSRPLICHRHGNNITLSWNPGRVPSYVKNSKMTYVVEVREPPSFLWRVLTDNLTDNEFDVNNLNPEQDYMFRVRAKNDFGQSEPTLPASVFREKDDYTPPNLSRSGSTSPWVNRSRASSLDRQRSFSLTDDDIEPYLNKDKKGCPPEFKTPIENIQYGVENQPAKITLNLRGYPLPRTSWFYLGEKLEYGELYTASVSPAGTATLDIRHMTGRNVGDYKCCAENEHGVATKVVRLLLADQPTILEPLKSTLTLESHGSGKLECRVDGTPAPTVKFLKDLRPLVGTSRSKVEHTPPNQWTLYLTGVMTMDGGTYTCVAENMAGKVTSAAKVVVADMDDQDAETITTDGMIREAAVEDFYYILEDIGRGSHSIVRRVVDKYTGSEYAAKYIPVTGTTQKQFFLNEVHNMKLLDHKGVPQVKDLFRTERHLVIIMELITGGDILSYIIRRKNQIEEDIAYYIEQLLLILKYLHSNKILHLDVKPSNIHLVEGSDTVCLLDFGFSRMMKKDGSTRLNFGSPDFTSPEQINDEPLSEATDLWNVGLVTYTLLCGRSPFHGCSDSETLNKIQSCNWSIDEELFDGISKEAKDFISKLLVKEPSERLSMGACLDHPFITGDCEDGQGKKINIESMREYNKACREKRSRRSVGATVSMVTLKTLLSKEGGDKEVFCVEIEEGTGSRKFPDSVVYGEFLDEESWFDWQARINHEDDDLDQEDYDVIRKKELEWLTVAEEYKKQSQQPQGFFPKDEEEVNIPQFLCRLQNQTFQPGQDLTLTCRVVTAPDLSVSWSRNEEPLVDGGRVKTSFSKDGVASLTMTGLKPYDDGLFKCVVRSKTGKASSWARVSIGEIPSQPSRPIITQISSCDALLLWEHTSVEAKYRVDYREQGTEEWMIGAYSINETALVTGLTPSTVYLFRVSAFNAVGSSPYSISSVPTKTLKEGSDDIELEHFESLLLSRQQDEKPSLEEYQPQPREITLKETNFENEYELNNSIRGGAFGESFVTREIGSNNLFTMKSFPTSEEDQTHLVLLRDLQLNSHILRLRDCYQYQNKISFVSEYFCGINVLEHFAFKTRYSEEMVAIVMTQILHGVLFLHQNGIVHLNLQPDSIVMSSLGRLDVRITDFSLARKISSKEGEVVPIKGNMEFIAPEIITQDKTSYPADIWTVGVLAFILLSGESPFFNKEEEITMTNIAYTRYNPLALYDNITKDALKFIFKVLKRVPRNRMLAKDCLEDRWLQGSDSVIRASQNAVFATAKLRSYIENAMTRRGNSSSLPGLEDLKKLFSIPAESRHRYIMPVRNVEDDAEDNKKEVSNPSETKSSDDLELTGDKKNRGVTDTKTQDSACSENASESICEESKENVNEMADNIVSKALTDALEGGEITKQETS